MITFLTQKKLWLETKYDLFKEENDLNLINNLHLKIFTERWGKN